MKPSARVREQAAVICAIRASNSRDLLWIEIAQSIDADHDAYELANRAFAVAAWTAPVTWPDYDPVYAEAEALIRTGWVP